MSIRQIIDEELEAAKQRIQARIQSFLVGGSSATPFSPSGTSKHVLTGAGLRSRDELTERALAYIKDNPGTGGREIIEALGIDPKDRNLRASIMGRLKGKVITKGRAAKAVYYAKGAKVEAEKKVGAKKKLPETGRPALISKIAEKALVIIAESPGNTSQAIGKTLNQDFPDATSQHRYDAYKKLIDTGKVRVEPGHGMSRLYFPIL